MGHNFLNANCMDYLTSAKDNQWDLAFVDAPFGIGEDGRKQYSLKVRQKNGNILAIKQRTEDDLWDNEPPAQGVWDQIFRTSRYQIIWGCNYLEFDQKSKSSGRIIWDKVNGSNDFSDCEIAWTNLFSSVRQIEFMWNGMMQGKSLMRGRVQRGNKKLNQQKIQYCQKPIELYQWCLQLSQVKQRWQIVDTHAGSGSSLIACELEGFDYDGFEISENRYNRAKERII